MPRKFIYDGREFPDPGQHMSPDEVRASMVTFFPELTNATIKGPRTEGDYQVYELERRVGTKGQCIMALGINIVAARLHPIIEVTLSEEDYLTLQKKASKLGMPTPKLVAKILRDWNND